MATLREELASHGNGVGQLGSSINDAVPKAISVFFNPTAGDVMMEAAINDILDKLKRGAELLQSRSIGVTVLHTRRNHSHHRNTHSPTNRRVLHNSIAIPMHIMRDAVLCDSHEL